MFDGGESVRVIARAEVGVGEVKPSVIGNGVGFKRGLKVLDCFAVHPVARQEHAHAHGSAEIAGA